MAISDEQKNAFEGGTFGVGMDDFQLTILLIFYGILYLWTSWVIYTQWIAWSHRKIHFYALLTRTVRCALLTLFASFLIH